MDILLVLLILLVAARGFGELAVRLGQPAMVGELLAGAALGALVAAHPDVVPTFAQFPAGDLFRGVIDLAIFFLVLLAGIEMRPEQIARASSSAFFVALGGMAVPLALGFGLGWIFLPESGVKLVQALFLGTALSITAVPVAIRMLMDMGRLHTRVGEIIVSAAIFDDIFSLVLLAMLTAMLGTGEPPTLSGLAGLIGQVLLFLAVVTGLGLFVLPRLGPLLIRIRVPERDVSLLLIAALAYAVTAEALGMHFILGAFAAGLFFGRRTATAQIYDRVKSKISGFTGGFLAPIFFASIGFRFEVTALVQVPVFTLLLIIAALAGKLAGAGLPAYWRGLDARSAACVGTGMSARGAVELIVADVALRAGLFAMPAPPPPIVANLFSAVVLMAIVTTVVAPIALRLVFPKDTGAPQDTDARE